MLTSIVVCPEGSEKLLSLLDEFKCLNKEQVVMFLMQTDETFNRKRCEVIINKLKKAGVIIEKNNYISRDNSEPDQKLIDAFWVLLHYVDENSNASKGRYPAEIVFEHDGVISEILVCSEDLLSKMDFLSKRCKRKNKVEYYILNNSETIDELDDELYPEEPFSIITVSGEDENGIPKMMFHEVISSEDIHAKPKAKPSNDYISIDEDGDYNE
jgi:hypothetical protein